jgi:hypothetical protein
MKADLHIREAAKSDRDIVIGFIQSLNEDALRLYERFGFGPHVRILLKPLG